MNSYSNKTNIFVIGLHRSGTTLLARMISRHHNVSSFVETGFPQDEGQFLQTVYPLAQMHGGPGRFGFESAAYMNENSIILTKKNISKLQREWGEHWDMGCKYMLEKSPPNILKTRFLQSVFPNTFFILIKRNPVAVSYATRKWSNTNIYSLMKHWLVCHEIFYKDMEYLKNVKVVSYEDLVNTPADILEDIFNFLKIDNSRVVEVDDDFKKNINQSYIRLWEQDYKSEWFTKKVKYHLLNQKVRKYGYSIIPDSLGF